MGIRGWWEHKKGTHRCCQLVPRSRKKEKQGTLSTHNNPSNDSSPPKESNNSPHIMNDEPMMEDGDDGIRRRAIILSKRRRSNTAIVWCIECHDWLRQEIHHIAIMLVVDWIDYMWTEGGGGGPKCTVNGTAVRFSIQDGSIVAVAID